MPKLLRNKEERSKEAKSSDDEAREGKAKGSAPKARSSSNRAVAPAPAAPKPAGKPKPAFPKKAPAPTQEAFVARLPLPVGKKWESVRAFLAKQEGVAEDVHYYGPKSGWGLRYVVGGRTPLCALFLLGDRPIGIVSITGEIDGQIDWAELSPVAKNARRLAHGSPALLWLDLPLDGTGATDFKALLKAKLGALPR